MRHLGQASLLRGRGLRCTIVADSSAWIRLHQMRLREGKGRCIRLSPRLRKKETYEWHSESWAGGTSRRRTRSLWRTCGLQNEYSGSAGGAAVQQTHVWRM